VRLAGLAQVHVQIDEAGRDDQSASIEFLVRAALDLLGGATSATRPSFSSTSMGASMRAAGSMRWPPLISRLVRFFFLR
jgi:hypothetical protein